jgi:hypothetical protein
MPGEDADHRGSRDSSEELEAPALQSSTGEHRIVDIEPRTRTLGLEEPQKEEDPSPSSAEKGDRREEKMNGRRWNSKEDGLKKSMTSSVV